MDCDDRSVARVVTITDEQPQYCAAADGITAPEAPLLRDQAKAPKAAIQPALKAETGARWDRDDYRTFYDKVTETLLSEGVPKSKAEAFAIECAVMEWLSRSFEPSPPGCYVHCGRGEHGGDALLPVGTESAGRVWLHKGCRDGWHADRRAKAFAALADLGISHTGRLSTVEKKSPPFVSGRDTGRCLTYPR
jgi:hypothetical protein